MTTTSTPRCTEYAAAGDFHLPSLACQTPKAPRRPWLRSLLTTLVAYIASLSDAKLIADAEALEKAARDAEAGAALH